LTELIYHILTAEFAFGESPLPSPQQAGGYPAEALYEFASELKDTSLAYTIGVIELLRRAKYIVSYTYGNNTLLVYGVCALMYLVLVRTGNVILYRLERRLAIPGFERREEGG